MALEMNDLMMLRGMDSKEGLSPYKQDLRQALVRFALSFQS